MFKSGKSRKSIEEKDMSNIKPENVHEVLSKYMLADGMEYVVDLKKSHGSWLVDSRTGKEYLDFFTFFASLPIGFNHPKLTTREFMDKLAYVAVNKPSNSDLYTVEMAEFVETFARVAMKEPFKHLFFVSGGALAVENALKTAMDWKVKKNIAKGLKEEKGHKILHFQQAFHGRTGYTISLTNTADARKYLYFDRFDWPRVLNPKVVFPLTDENISNVKAAEKKSIEQIYDFIKKEGDDIAAIIIEPIQGEGGDNHFRKEFMQKLRQITLENEMLLIFDEVQSGMGLTGKWWAEEHYDVFGDIVAFGKKAQVCGIMATDRILEIEKNVFEESSRLNSTWGGNLVDMVRSQKYLEIIEEESLVDNAAKMGNYIVKGLLELGKNQGEKMSNIRGKGLMIAFDLNNGDKRNETIALVRSKNVIVLPCGERSVRLRPPLNVSEEECNIALDAITYAINNL